MADTTATITYFAVKGMHFYNAESCKELIIVAIRAGPTIFFRVVYVGSLVFLFTLPVAIGLMGAVGPKRRRKDSVQTLDFVFGA